MKISRDVVTDLLPAFFSGEASADTRALVEEFFRQDPEFARLAQDQKSQTMLNLMPVQLPPEHERATLSRTKTLLRLRTFLLAFAIFLSLLPIRFSYDNTGIHPIPVVPMWANSSTWVCLAAVGCWIGFGVTLYRLRTTKR